MAAAGSWSEQKLMVEQKLAGRKCALKHGALIFKSPNALGLSSSLFALSKKYALTRGETGSLVHASEIVSRKVGSMLHSLTLGRSFIAAAAIVSGVAFGTPANANTITITPVATAGNDSPATVTSTLAGNVFVGLVDGGGAAFLAGTGSFTAATGFDLGASNPASEAALLTTECACGTTFAPSGTEQNTNAGIPATFSTAAEFFAIKADGWIAYFHNLTGGLLTLNYADAPGDGVAAGISHTQNFVPFPALGAGLPGLVLACGGLIALARRRRQQFA
jgi:hypothetical protein